MQQNTTGRSVNFMKIQRKMKRKAHVIGLIIGIVLTPILMLFVLLATGGGHGSYKPAIVLFPYTALGTVLLESLASPLIAVAAGQFPFYGWHLGRALQAGRSRHALWIIPVAHTIVVIIAFSIPS